MDATPQSTQLIQSLRPDDLVGHRQQPARQYEELMVDEQRFPYSTSLRPGWSLIAALVIIACSTGAALHAQSSMKTG